MKTTTYRLAASLALVLAMAPLAARADYPEKPIAIIVGYAAGGGTDILARTVAPYVEKYLGGNAKLVIKNVPGAGGQIGFTQVASAAPDGYTIGTFNLPAAAAMTLDRKAEYTMDSFTYLVNMVEDPSTLVVNKESTIKSVSDLVAMAKKEPGSVTVGLASLAGNDHFAALEFGKSAGVELALVPFKGAAPARSALMGGHVKLGTMAFSQTTGFEDELRVIGVFSAERLAQAPNVPTVKEQGFNVEMGSLRGFVGPAGLPPEITKKLTAAFESAFADPALKSALEKQGAPLRMVSGAAYKALSHHQSAVAKEIWERVPWK